MFFSLYYYVVAPQGSWFKHTWISTTSGCFTLFPFGLFPLYVHMLKFDFAFYGPNLPLGSWFEPAWIYSIWGCFSTSYRFLQVFKKRTLKKLILYMYVPLLIFNTHCKPFLHIKIMVWTTKTLHYFKLL